MDVSENQVIEVQKLAFKDIYLTHINLSKNKITNIESGAFENCANITKLDLSFNNLTTLPKKAFDETTYATELQFSYNMFTNLSQVSTLFCDFELTELILLLDSIAQHDWHKNSQHIS